MYAQVVLESLRARTRSKMVPVAVTWRLEIASQAHSRASLMKGERASENVAEPVTPPFFFLFFFSMFAAMRVPA